MDFSTMYIAFQLIHEFTFSLFLTFVVSHSFLYSLSFSLYLFFALYCIEITLIRRVEQIPSAKFPPYNIFLILALKEKLSDLVDFLQNLVRFFL